MDTAHEKKGSLSENHKNTVEIFGVHEERGLIEGHIEG